jgi:hypothetical protein
MGVGNTQGMGMNVCGLCRQLRYCVLDWSHAGSTYFCMGSMVVGMYIIVDLIQTRMRLVVTWFHNYRRH